MPMIINLPRAGAWLAVVAFACGCAGRTRPPPDSSAPRASPPSTRAPTSRPAPPVQAGRGKSFPDCDPRHQDPDRGRAAMGLLAGDCLDDRGRNRAYVTRLVPVGGGASPAGQAGVMVGDRIARVDACEVTSTHELAQQLATAVPGWVARIVVERDGRELEIFVPTIGLSGKGRPGTPNLSTAGCQAIKRKPAQP